ncbi:MAG: VIT1/CCC1 transporter family protein [Parachlamydiales bacterium]|nr:VIT1/CCC1 transporter family protein [Parachlamydiales bacterium]
MDHFEGKEALEHVIEKKALGALEAHGTEMPGYLAAAADSARNTALILGITFILLSFIPLHFNMRISLLFLLALGLFIGHFCRSAWLAWSRLERLHRIMEQERYEIENHRQQEREELSALYAAKGFSGKLLEQVMDVLMANGDRLLRVMLEEELGLTLEGYEHPLKQGFGAGIGALIAIAICMAGIFIWPAYGVVIAALLVLGFGAAVAAKAERNLVLPAFIWYTAIGALSMGTVYFAAHMLF